VNLVRLGPEDFPLLAVPPARIDQLREGIRGHVPVHRFVPNFLVRPPAGNARVLSISQWRAGGHHGERTFFYLSVTCFAVLEPYGWEEWRQPPDRMRRIHPGCAWMLSHHDLMPVWMERIPNRSELAPAFQWYDDRPDLLVGLFEVAGGRESVYPADSFANLALGFQERAKPSVLARDYAAASAVIEEGERLLADSVVMADQVAAFRFLEGVNMQQRDKVEQSLAALARIEAVDPHYPQLLSRTGSTFLAYIGFLPDREAASFVEERLVRAPGAPSSRYLKALWLFYGPRDYQASIDLLEQVRGVVGDDPRVYMYLALDHFYLGHGEEAERLIGQAIEVSGGRDPDAFYVHSIIFRQKDLAVAVRDIERYLELSAGPDKVRSPKKEQWLRKELESLKQGIVSEWWRSRDRSEPWAQ
jgi:tetratricopeptide (TPR) repeat protein